MNSIHPPPHTPLAAPAVHDARTPAGAEEGKAVVLGGGFAQEGDFLARGDVVGADEGVEAHVAC